MVVPSMVVATVDGAARWKSGTRGRDAAAEVRCWGARAWDVGTGLGAVQGFDLKGRDGMQWQRLNLGLPAWINYAQLHLTIDHRHRQAA